MAPDTDFAFIAAGGLPRGRPGLAGLGPRGPGVARVGPQSTVLRLQLAAPDCALAGQLRVRGLGLPAGRAALAQLRARRYGAHQADRVPGPALRANIVPAVT